ncbi:hypothetical protein [uncultured Ruegeria sp.]|uniref:hypothetical protein n=1 Tax=uncultured Ruegeria sp. TaxID=259304 RepID=UPI002639E190|nr:hypothetical protein [uncultured Ruegeria sp.]
MKPALIDRLLKPKVLFCTYAVLIFAAYMQPLDQSLFTPNLVGNTPPPFFVGLYLATWVAPSLPALIALLTQVGSRQIPSVFAKLFTFLLVAAGLCLTLAVGVFSLFSDTQILHGLTLTIAVASSILIWSGDDGKPRPSRVAKLGISVSTIAALWSLMTVPMILGQARFIADGSTYCIAHHSRNSPVETLHELRGFSFYTEKTGYKSTSEWFFHGLMIVDHLEGQKFYNWSPRRWRFDLVARPNLLFEPVSNVCVPN